MDIPQDAISFERFADWLNTAHLVVLTKQIVNVLPHAPACLAEPSATHATLSPCYHLAFGQVSTSNFTSCPGLRTGLLEGNPSPVDLLIDYGSPD